MGLLEWLSTQKYHLAKDIALKELEYHGVVEKEHPFFNPQWMWVKVAVLIVLGLLADPCFYRKHCSFSLARSVPAQAEVLFKHYNLYSEYMGVVGRIAPTDLTLTLPYLYSIIDHVNNSCLFKNCACGISLEYAQLVTAKIRIPSVAYVACEHKRFVCKTC